MGRSVARLGLGLGLSMWVAVLALGGAAAHPGEARPGDSPAGAPLAVTGTAFTYQGQLTENAGVANGAYDFRFSLYDVSAGGAPLAGPLEIGDVPVTNGLFTARIDFGAGRFGGGARWLQIEVRPGNSGGAYTALSPRQELTPTGYALALPNVYADETAPFVGIGRNTRISGNEVFGVRYTGGANEYGGMYVETSDAQGWPFYGYATNGSFRAWTYLNGASGDWALYNAGVRLLVPDEGGLRIGPSVDYSLVISNTTGSDGIRVLDTGDDSIQIGSPPDVANYGVYIPSPGVSTYGLWPNTANAAGEWALYTVDNIQAGNVFMQGLTLVARVDGQDDLGPGDVVAVSGTGETVPGGQTRLPLVRLAQAPEYTGAIGVVQSRMVYAVAPGKEPEGEMSLTSADGPARPGDYVAIVVLGVTQVKVTPGAAIKAGDRLTVSEIPGLARSLQTRLLDGMVVTEGAQAVGIALASPRDGEAAIPVFITLR